MWYITYTVGILAAFMLSYTFFFCTTPPEEETQLLGQTAEKQVLLQNSFQQKGSLQDGLKSPFFSLAAIDRPLRLPDLRSFFTFLGCNERPDLELEKMRVQLSLRGGNSLTVNAGEKVYLRFEGKGNKWGVSEKPTCLYAVFKPKDTGVDVTVEIQEESGTTIATPSEYHQFYLNAMPTAAQGSISARKWDVGGLNAEPLLLEKQGARWYGKDSMVEALGGEEYLAEASRERVQFGSEEGAYVLFVKEGDCFVFNEERWVPAVLGDETKKKILLRAKKVDDKEILFDLWNGDGSLHAVCSLKHREDKGHSSMPELKLIGARSQKHWIAEIGGKRIVLAPTDWIVFTEEGPLKIETEKTLEQYIQGVIPGSLLAFSGLEKVNGEVSFIGAFFNDTRSSKEEVSIPLYRSCIPAESPSKKMETDEDDEDDDDDENDPFLDEDDDEDDES